MKKLEDYSSEQIARVCKGEIIHTQAGSIDWEITGWENCTMSHQDLVVVTSHQCLLVNKVTHFSADIIVTMNIEDKQKLEQMLDDESRVIYNPIPRLTDISSRDE